MGVLLRYSSARDGRLCIWVSGLYDATTVQSPRQFGLNRNKEVVRIHVFILQKQCLLLGGNVTRPEAFSFGGPDCLVRVPVCPTLHFGNAVGDVSRIPWHVYAVSDGSA